MEKNLSRLMQMVSLTLVLILGASAVTLAQAGKINFAGTWALNSSKSSPSASGKGDLFIKQEPGFLTATSTDSHGMSSIYRYNLDGKESINKVGMNESRSTAKFSPDGKSITIVTKETVDGKERTSQEVWSLVNPGTLSIVETAIGTSGDEQIRYIYDKK